MRVPDFGGNSARCADQVSSWLLVRRALAPVGLLVVLISSMKMSLSVCTIRPAVSQHRRVRSTTITSTGGPHGLPRSGAIASAWVRKWPVSGSG